MYVFEGEKYDKIIQNCFLIIYGLKMAANFGPKIVLATKSISVLFSIML